MRDEEQQLLLADLKESAEIDEMFACPPALRQQNTAVQSVSAAWFAQWPNKTRIRIIIVIYLSSLLALISSVMYYPCLQAINDDLQPNYASSLGIASYGNILLYALAIPIWGSLSNRYSRRYVQLVCLLGFALLSYAIALSWTMFLFVPLNFLLGIVTSGLPSVSFKILFDILPPAKRGSAVALFISNSIASIVIGPFVAGIIIHVTRWEYCYFIVAILASLSFLLHLLFVPETLEKAKVESFVPPFTGLFGLLHGAEFFLVSILLSLTSALLYLIFLVIATVFPNKYDLSPFYVGLVYLVMGVGIAFGSTFGGTLSHVLRKKYDIGGRLIVPILVLYGLSLGSMLLGWSLGNTTDMYIPLIIIVICSVMRGFISPGLISYCVELNPNSAADIVEALTVIQLLVAALFQMTGTSLAVVIDYPLAFSVIGILMILCSIPVLVGLYKRLKQARSQKDESTNKSINM